MRTTFAGIAAGLAAGLVLVFAQLALRVLLGISPPPEAIPDRFAPTLSIAQFFRLLDLFGGYDGLKQFGVGSILLGELFVAALVGAVYARLRAFRPNRAVPFLAAFVATAWLLSVVVLWPVLGANYRGVPQPLATWLSLAALLLSYVSYAVALVLVLRGVRPPRVVPDAGRRAAVRLGLTAVVAGIGSLVLLRNLFDRATFDYDGLEFRGPELLPVVPNDRFYTVTKNVVDPDVEPAWWRLSIRGAVERSLDLSYADLIGMPSTRQETTLMCISNYVGGGLISNALWDGVPLRQLLDAAVVGSGAVEVVVHGADGYTDTVPIAKALDGTCFLAYGMNGEPLPARHGGPVRLLVPGLFGEKSVKWVTALDVVTENVKGFYEQQGWGPTFMVPTRSGFFHDSVDARLGQAVPLNGWAFGGDRGVASVEVSTDNGARWLPARLEYPGSRLSWALWRLAWQPTAPGEYRLLVRTVDGLGNPQTDQYRDTTPDGATGYHVITARVSA